MDPLRFLLDLVKAHDETERVRAEARERILRKYGAELGLDVQECCRSDNPSGWHGPLHKGAYTECHGLRPCNNRERSLTDAESEVDSTSGTTQRRAQRAF